MRAARAEGSSAIGDGGKLQLHSRLSLIEHTFATLKVRIRGLTVYMKLFAWVPAY